MSHDLSLSRSFPISIYDSLTVVYSAGASVVLNGSQNQSIDASMDSMSNFSVSCFMSSYCHTM